MINLTRLVTALVILIAGACTTAVNWRFLYQLGTSEFDSIVLATFSVALDVAKWLMLPLAALAWRTHKFRAVAALLICARYVEVAAKITGAPRDADPQSALFARMTGVYPDTMRIVLSVFLAVAREVISALGFYAILTANTTINKLPAKTAPAPVRRKPPKW